MTVAQAVLFLEPSDEFHVLLPALVTDEVLPFRYRATVLRFDGGKIAGGPLTGFVPMISLAFRFSR